MGRTMRWICKWRTSEYQDGWLRHRGLSMKKFRAGRTGVVLFQVDLA